MPRWADVVLIPLITCAGVLPPIVSGDRREPDQGDPGHGRGRVRLDLRLGLHALLRHQLHLHRPRRRRRLPCPAVQHRRRGAGAGRRPRRGAGLLLLPSPWPHWTLALLCAPWPARRCSAPPGRRSRPICRPSAAAISSSPRSCSTSSPRALLNYPAERWLKPRRPHGRRDRQVSRSRAHLPTAFEMLAPFGIKFSRSAPANFAFFVALVAACRGLGADLAHPAGLPDPRLRPFRVGGDLCRHHRRSRSS